MALFSFPYLLAKEASFFYLLVLELCFMNIHAILELVLGRKRKLRTSTQLQCRHEPTT
jgi:hypothetical protein